MGNTTSAKSERARSELYKNGVIQKQQITLLQQQQELENGDNKIESQNEIIRIQSAMIQQLTQEIQNGENKIKSQNEIIRIQSAMVQQLTQEIRRRDERRLTHAITRETQTDQDHVDNHAVILHRTPCSTSSNIEYRHNVTDRLIGVVKERPKHSEPPGSRSSNIQYRHHVSDRLIDVVIERPKNSEPPGKSNIAVLRLYNASNLTWSHNLKNTKQTLMPRLGAGEKLYYHGSNDFNVKSILENGIDVTKSVRATDFSCGSGFYVTKNFGKAVEWSKRVAGWKKGRPAVIAFRISKSLRKEEPHLALKVDTTTNRKWWECVVTYFRHSATSADMGNVLRGVKFIKGPVANNKYVRSNELPRPFNFTQLCIRDEEYALRFGSLKNIAFVIFAVDT